MNPKTGEIRIFDEGQMPEDWIKLPRLPKRLCGRCMGIGHVGRQGDHYRPCPDCFPELEDVLLPKEPKNYPLADQEENPLDKVPKVTLEQQMTHFIQRLTDAQKET